MCSITVAYVILLSQHMWYYYHNGYNRGMCVTVMCDIAVLAHTYKNQETFYSSTVIICRCSQLCLAKANIILTIGRYLYIRLEVHQFPLLELTLPGIPDIITAFANCGLMVDWGLFREIPEWGPNWCAVCYFCVFYWSILWMHQWNLQELYW